MDRKDIRWRQRFENYKKALARLEAALAVENPSNIELAGAVQFFEIVFELAWKTMKDFAESKGVLVNNPRDTVKAAFEMETIGNAGTWLEALLDRNATTHLYDEKEIAAIVEKIRTLYAPLFRAFAQTLTTK